MGKYKLINPNITGTFNSTVSESNANNAAKKIWEKLSKNIVNNVPHLMFTIKNESSNQLYHYSVKEKMDSSNNANILIEKVDVSLNASQKKKFLNQIKSVETTQYGGDKEDRKRYDDSSSSSSDDSDSDYALFMKYKKRSPIFRYWYTPSIYTINKPSSLTIFNPVFKYPINPYVELFIPTTF